MRSLERRLLLLVTGFLLSVGSAMADPAQPQITRPPVHKEATFGLHFLPATPPPAPQAIPVSLPPPLPNRVILGTPSELMPDGPTPIFMPSAAVAATGMDSLTVHYFNPSDPTALTPPAAAPPAAPAWLENIAKKVNKLQKLAKRLDRIVNPRITTKNFDIKFNLFYHP